MRPRTWSELRYQAARRWRETTVRLEVKLQDAWIGAFWRRDGAELHVWICLVPCLPIHIRTMRP